MRLIVDQSLATGFIPINTWQQRTLLPFKPGGGVLERKLYNNDDINMYKHLTSSRIIMCSSPHRFTIRAATYYHTQLGKGLYTGKNVLSS